MALQAKEFQAKQIYDRKNEIAQIKTKEHKEAKSEFKKFEGLVQREREESDRIKQKLLDNQNDLFRQMEERQTLNIINSTMNNTDYKFNAHLIKNITNEPKLPPMMHRKPW